jgi:hypothetical protein
VRHVKKRFDIAASVSALGIGNRKQKGNSQLRYYSCAEK